MSLDLFRLDWILIDTVIIILLLLLLFSVKVFKEISRWRFSLSNESLEHIKLKNLETNADTSNVIIKNCSVIKKGNRRDDESSRVVVFLSTKMFKRKLVRILTEGLGSYGHDIVKINLKIKPGMHTDNSERSDEISVRKALSKILKHSEQNKFISSSKFFVMHYSDSPLLYKSILSDENNAGMISIKHKIKKINHGEFSSLVDLEHKYHLIYSRKSYLTLNNKSLEKFLKENPHYNKLGNHLTIIEKSRKSFKYYETILLGIILKILEIETKK